MSPSFASIVMVSCAAGLLGACAPSSSESVDHGDRPPGPADNCTGVEAPAYVTPTYTRPADDSVALSSLLEGAGYAFEGNSDWVDVAAGNFCGGPESELILLKNRPSNFSVMRGPAPYAVGTGNLDSRPAHPWRAVAAGKLDAGAYDLIAAVRQVSASGVPDLVVARVDSASCLVVDAVATATIGTPLHSQWRDAAIGNFDGTGNRIALLEAGQPNVVLVALTAGSLKVIAAVDLDSDPQFPWKAIAAGDLDGDGVDELVAAREVSDGQSATVIAYKWSASGLQPFATATFGNNGNSDWSSMAIGDFNADRRRAIVLVKNQHSNFIVLDLPASGEPLRELATADLDSVTGQDWRGLTAIDWLGGDQGASELVAVRAARDPYRTDLLVYGNAFHRIVRDTGLDHTRAQWVQVRSTASDAEDALVHALLDTHTNTLNWHIGEHPDAQPGSSSFRDYLELVKFLEHTRNLCVDGRHLRVWATLVPPPIPSRAVDRNNCSLPEDSPLTPWNELALFGAGPGGDTASLCTDYLGWGSLLGRLAQDYPHLVAVGMDDFGDHPELLPGDYIAEMESRMRSQAPWLSFVPTAYYRNFKDGKWPDLTRTVDSLLFFFRNEREGLCLAGSCGENSIRNMPGEVAFMSGVLPAGRMLHLGVYFVTYYAVRPPQIPTIRYDYELVRLAMGLPELTGVTAYAMQPDPGFTCNDFNYLEPNVRDSRYCTLWKNYGDGGCSPGQTRACGYCGTQTCGAGFTWDACSQQGVCTPGEASETPCGDRCGVRVDTCTDSCQWVTGICEQGACSPGSIQACCPCGGSSCSCAGEQLCRADCTWSSCLGYACEGAACP
jgi:hypothetical protein